MILARDMMEAIKAHKQIHPEEFHDPELTLMVVALTQYHNLIEQKNLKQKQIMAEDIVECVHRAMTFYFG